MKIITDISEIAKCIVDGGIVCFPTDTLFAMSCDATNQKAIEKVYAIKRRVKDKKLSVFFKDIEHVSEHCIMPDNALRLAERFWPGPLTMVLDLKPNSIMRDLQECDSLAVRVPNSPHILEIISVTGKPLVGTSANISGMENPLSYEDLYKQFGNEDITVLNMDLKLSGIQSTIVGFEENILRIIREGVIEAKDLFPQLTDLQSR